MAAPPPKNLADLPPEVLAYNNGPVLLAQTASFFSVAALVVLGRCYTRIFMVKSFGRDDWAMLLAMVRNSPNFGLSTSLTITPSYSQPYASYAMPFRSHTA